MTDVERSVVPYASGSAQATIRGDVLISGVGTFSGEPCTIRLEPGAVDSGLVVVSSGVEIPCTLSHLVPQSVHTSGVEFAGHSYRSIEHLLAAFSLLGITNCRIVAIQGSEVPNPTGGSCEAFVGPIERAGLVQQKQRVELLRIAKPGSFSWERSTAVYEPLVDTDALELVVHIDFPQPIGRQTAEWSSDPMSPNHLPDCFTRARSFIRRDLAEIRESGVNHWIEVRKTVQGLPDNIDDLQHMAFAEGEWVVPPRYQGEVAWHKLIDLAGDLMLLGRPLAGRVIVHLPGHAFNHRLMFHMVGQDTEAMPLTAALA